MSLLGEGNIVFLEVFNISTLCINSFYSLEISVRTTGLLLVLFMFRGHGLLHFLTGCHKISCSL